jgi:predicted MFS family arabinose efflux permease
MSESAPTASPHRDRATSVRRNGLSKVGAIATTPGDMPSPRHPLAARASFWITAAIAFLAFAANAAASPLYRVYQAQLHFSATTLTLLFTVYVAVLLITLLFLGSLSDYLGRRVIILAGIIAGATGCSLFVLAHGVGLLFAARALQGLAVGLISGAASAALLDLRPASPATLLISSAAVSAGQGVGAIGAAALAQYAPAPTRLIWWLLLGGFLVGGLALTATPEPGLRRPGALRSLRPQVSVPPNAKTAFVVAVPCLVAVWALAGMYLSLGPSLAGLLVHSQDLLWGGVLILLFTGLGATASAALTRREPSQVMLGGCILLIAGALVTFSAIEAGTPALFFVGTAFAGLGFGPAFSGAFRAVVALAPSWDRAGLVTAIYIVSYLATGIPAVMGGLATSHYGLHKTAIVYSLAVAAIAAVAVLLLIIRMRPTERPLHQPRLPRSPLGAGTVPPCPPISP